MLATGLSSPPFFNPTSLIHPCNVVTFGNVFNTLISGVMTVFAMIVSVRGCFITGSYVSGSVLTA